MDDEHMQYVWGARYIDDIVLHRIDIEPNGTYDDIYYHLTDAQFSTVAVADQAANLKERVSYTAYGVARHHWTRDVDGDGDRDPTDDAIINTLAIAGGPGAGTPISSPEYDVAADINRDGVINYKDKTLLSTVLAALPQGQLSGPGVRNEIGWDGYVFNAETAQYHVRFRWYSPVLGRWLTRDPVGYVDSVNPYECGMGGPTMAIDPFVWPAWPGSLRHRRSSIARSCQSRSPNDRPGANSTCALPGRRRASR
ncbi:MAG: hypothetical protein IID28_06215 [Planctomycetes bacterium]|nr:hypothetical protein [Planctomycetota bacterium]